MAHFNYNQLDHASIEKEACIPAWLLKVVFRTLKEG